MASRDGNGWVRCSLGHRHWGKFGAAGLLAYAGEPDETQILLQRRVAWSHYGGTWGLPGGAADSHETPVEAALREAAEECGVPPDAVVVHGIYTDDHGGWAYHTVFARAAAPFAAYPASEETDDVDWVPADRAAELDLHPGLAAHWAELRAGLLPLTVIVDAANVVGSRPDGWWRDRAGAARRLVSGVTALAGAGVDLRAVTSQAAGRLRGYLDELLTRAQSAGVVRTDVDTHDLHAIVFGALTAEQRQIVLLADVEDFSYQEIGEIVGCSVGTVRSRLHRARGQLRNLVNRYMKTSP